MSRRTGLALQDQHSLEIGMVLFSKVTLLDVAGPFEVFKRAPGVELSLMAAEAEPLLTDTGLSLVPERDFEEAGWPDVLFVPGGPGQIGAMDDDRTLSFLRERGTRAAFVSSVCTGSLLLAAAGLLKGYRATTHWLSLDLLGCLGATPVAERVVRDRNRLTGAGVSAGIDVALQLVALLCGDEVAQEIQLLIEYDPQPPFTCGSPRTAPHELVARVASRRQELQDRRREQVERFVDGISAASLALKSGPADVPAQPEVATTKGEDDRLHFQWISRPGKRALVVLNTITGDSRSWAGLFAPLAERLPVVCVDVRNRGRSKFTGRAASVHEQLEDVAQLVHAAGVTEPIWVGNSASTLLACRAAQTLSSRALILLAPLFSFGMVRKVRLLRNTLLASLEDSSLRSFHRLLTFLTYGGEYLDRNASIIPVGLSRLRALYTADTLRVACDQTFFPEPEDPTLIKSISCPVLMVRPEGEELMSERRLDDVAAALSHCVVRVVPSGHGLLEEAPKATFDLIASFVEGLGSEPTGGDLLSC